MRQISRILKMSRKTVRRILAGKAPDKIQRPSRYESLAPLVCELFNRYQGNAVRIQAELTDQYGHHVPYASLTHRVRALNLRPDKTQRSGTFTYPPGREAQHDTSPHRVTIADKTVKAQCASMVLANSRLLFFQYYPRFTRFEAKVFLSTALDYFDAAPELCIIDNTSVLVAAGSGADAVIAPQIEAFAAIYGMRFMAHAIGHANRSALVERNFHYIENNFLPGQNFSNWQALNAACRNWCDQVANSKIKRALGMTPRQAYQSERPFLKPLPAVRPPLYQALSRTVDMYGYVTVDTNRYSVPERLCAKSVEVHKGLYDMRIFYNHRLVASHERLIDQRDTKSTTAGHHQPVARKSDKRASALMRRLLGHSQPLDAYVARIAARNRSAATRQLQRLLCIKRNYPTQPFDQAVARALHYGVYDLGRLEKMILTLIAGDFFELHEHEPDNE
ncbi:IS21 family transposase [Thermodesulfobacteriota bacterium]